METVSELSSEILSVVDDSSFTITNVTSYLNKGLKEISGRVFLPELQTNGTVATDTVNYKALPADYQKNLYYCYSTAQSREIPVYNDFRHILRDVAVIDQAGYVFGVAVRGSNLHYQRIPSTSDTLQVHYYKKPTTLALTTDTPACLPDHLVRPLLVNYVCKEIFSLIEQGDARMNTDRHTQLYLEAMSDLINFAGVDHSFPVAIARGIDWNAEAYDF